jgi:hypothetical protein
MILLIDRKSYWFTDGLRHLIKMMVRRAIGGLTHEIGIVVGGY